MSADDIMFIIEVEPKHFSVVRTFASMIEEIDNDTDLLQYLSGCPVLWMSTSLEATIKFAQGERAEYGQHVLFLKNKKEEV